MQEFTVDISQILDGFARESENGHYECMIRIVLAQDDAKELCTKKLLYVKERSTILFCGIIQEVTIPSTVFGDWEAIIDAFSAGILLDEKICTHTYQNKSPKEIVEAVCGEYGGDCLIEEGIEKLPKGYYLQNDETDWSFLRRLLSVYSADLRVDWLSAKPKLYVDLKYNKKKSSNGTEAQSPLIKHYMPPFFFRNRQIYHGEVSRNGSKTVIRSGTTETMFEASDVAYDGDKYAIPAGWELIGRKLDKNSGFGAVILRRNRSIIIAFAGTDDMKDVKYDAYLNNTQYHVAMDYVYNTVKRLPKCDIYFTGHSLGGHLALESGLMLAQLGLSKDIKGIEIFNGLGARSSLATKRNIGLLEDKTISHEYRLDIVSELSTRFGEKRLYDDGKYNAAIKEDLARKRYFTVHRNVGKYSLANHSLEKFRPHFLHKPLSGIRPSSPLVRYRNITLKGKVAEVSKEGFRVSFLQDRFKTETKDAFFFQKSTAYVGVYMMPQVGDTAVVEFRISSLQGRDAFESAVCIRIERGDKK